MMIHCFLGDEVTSCGKIDKDNTRSLCLEKKNTALFSFSEILS